MITPKLARFADPDEPMLRAAINHIFGACKARVPDTPFLVRCVVGIVDKLQNDVTGANHIDEGREGLAYMMMHSIWQRAEIRGTDTSADIPALLTINTPRKHYQQWSLGGLQRKYNMVYRMSIPMANTLFINGRNSTLLESHWIKQASDEATFTRDRLVEVQEAHISSAVTPNETQFAIPSQPLTTWRTIKSCMGNVLREIDVDGEAVPASRELEEAVTTARSASQRSGQPPMQVFAIIRPATSAAESSEHSYALLANCLASRYSIHRVTGGGGGWGSKNGLLSLDPRNSFQEVRATPAFDPSADDPFQTSSKNKADICQPGDQVMFISNGHPSSLHNADSANDAHQEQQGGRSSDSEELQKIAIGVLAPQHDVALNSTTHDGSPMSPSSEPAITHRRNEFGLLTERGLALSFAGHLRPADLKHHSDELQYRYTHKTMLELPYSSIGMKRERVTEEVSFRLRKNHYDMMKEKNIRKSATLMERASERSKAELERQENAEQGNNAQQEQPKTASEQRKRLTGGRTPDAIVFDVAVPKAGPAGEHDNTTGRRQRRFRKISAENTSMTWIRKAAK